jgi:ribosome-associated toxin RatA of RatAB toxin-antitoxin module
MREVIRSALVPHTPAQMFALVEDVERYPEFLPGVVGAKLVEAREQEQVGRLEMEKAGVREQFTTRNTLTRPERIDMHLLNGPFRSLEGVWTFVPILEDGVIKGTRVGLTVRFEFRNPLTSMLLSRSFEGIFASLIDSFTKRAQVVYGAG